jgi:hypothetical protein
VLSHADASCLEALGVKSARSLSILDFGILAVFKIKHFWDKILHQKVVFATKTNLLGIEGATLPCCCMKNHAARTRQ